MTFLEFFFSDFTPNHLPFKLILQILRYHFSPKTSFLPQHRDFPASMDDSNLIYAVFLDQICLFFIQCATKPLFAWLLSGKGDRPIHPPCENELGSGDPLHPNFFHFSLVTCFKGLLPSHPCCILGPAVQTFHPRC